LKTDLPEFCGELHEDTEHETARYEVAGHTVYQWAHNWSLIVDEGEEITPMLDYECWMSIDTDTGSKSLYCGGSNGNEVIIDMGKASRSEKDKFDIHDDVETVVKSRPGPVRGERVRKR
jgi:hypothetical protein